MPNIESKMIIPGKEKELMKARVGDAIKISYPGYQDNMISMWTALFQESCHIYTFIAQEKSKSFGEESQIRQYTCPLNKIQFDDKLGATLNAFGYDLYFIKNLDNSYEKMVNVLKEAKLWAEDKCFALYDGTGDNLLGGLTDSMFMRLTDMQKNTFRGKPITLEQAKAMREILEKK
jgi:hypothetical protein